MQNQNCCICGLPLDPDNTSRCHGCGGYFHMPWSVTDQVKECGRPWLNQMSCGLVFLCKNCSPEQQQGEDQSPTQSFM